METMSESIPIKRLTDFKLLECHLVRRWLILQNNPNAFRYKLNVQRQKVLHGKLNMFVQLNTERSSLRRQPQTITSIAQLFNENAFNFNKVHECEILFHCQNQLCSNPLARAVNNLTTFMINTSPLTKYHSLICPRLKENLPQILTRDSIELAIDTIAGLNNRSYRIGYNSLGAFASVNHLHMHLICVEEKLYVEDAEIQHIFGYLYRLNFPVFAFCLPVFSWSNREQIATLVHKIVEYFCTKSIPHNIFWTWGTHHDQHLVKIFIFPRGRFADKIESSFNVAFCELVGYVPVGDADLYETLTEDFLLNQISEAIGPVDSQNLITEVMQLCCVAADMSGNNKHNKDSTREYKDTPAPEFEP